MGAGLVGEEVGHDATARELGDYVRAVSHQPHRSRLFLSHRHFQNAQRLVEVVDANVAIARADAPLDALRVHLDAEKRRAVERGGERLRPAHAAHPAGDH